ncbi:hypothetical protein VOLCADRAFT_119967 [Volvox carteri f. nagariensis]|uniref:ceramide glucosyltransferase n=1 Tax=Volvox carteri f. nagariensis TaxID=3068 RepID=D8UIH0_VOLCA|nr:uncharacterized protein VOLCADRAFT_119967 [Volvox carteri f. nagariensis]EFJ40451.1 hypothetical protein VOLCADRAFT_119967 [Volvox carteri f. nagariensis]|eukprot:XP_002958451.1 hypothetical protein VOLCADRAFT_119967 [Volvox carteri f. nagariensis]
MVQDLPVRLLVLRAAIFRGFCANLRSVVMPVKGCRPHSLDNWESHLGLMYDGPLEFVFVVESEEDPAAAPERAPNVSRSAQGRDVRLVVAGLASSCSQKVHNLCAGIESCDPRVARDGGYIMCLDDDVALHPGSLAELVSELEGRPHVFMATGYPFDIPPAGSSFTTYLALCYHLPLLIAFSVAPDTSFVWGGCMLLRAEKLLPEDPGELLAAWRHGGYSDDLILASYCTERRLGIRVPPFAVFPQKLDPRMGWAAWLNYLHRQLFVLDTYTNDHNRRTNHTMMVLHSVLSWLLVLPSLAALVTLVDRTVAVTAAVVAAAATGLATVATAPVEPTMAKAAGAEVGYCSVAFSGSGCGSSSSSRGLFSEGTAALLQPLLQLPVGVVAVVLGWAAAHSALVFMTGRYAWAEILGLFRQLSPAAPAIPLSWFRWGRLWAAMLLSNAVLPLIMLYTYISPWRQELLIMTAASGNLANLQVALKAAGCRPSPGVFVAAASSGNLNMCQWLAASDPELMSLNNSSNVISCAAEAARGGHKATVQWLLQLDNQEAPNQLVGFHAWTAAASSGQRALCEMLLAYGIPVSCMAAPNAARAGHVGLTHWLLQQHLGTARESSSADRADGLSPFPLQATATDVLAAAVYGFNLAAAQQLHQTILGQAATAADAALGGGGARGGRHHLSTRTWQQRAGGREIVLLAALTSPTPDWRDKVQWLVQTQDCSFSRACASQLNALAFARCCHTDDGIKERMQLLLQVPTATSAMGNLVRAAVLEANLPLLRCLRDGRPWLPESMIWVLELAAIAGRIEVVSELIELGWRVQPAASLAAASRGRLRTLQLLMNRNSDGVGQQGSEGPTAAVVEEEATAPFRGERGLELAEAAAESGSVETLEWLRSRGCPWDERTFAAAVRGGSGALVEWLHVRGCPIGDPWESHIGRACDRGDLATVGCLRRLSGLGGNSV